MKLGSIRPLVVPALALAFLCMGVVNAWAPWSGNADDLPGMSTKELVITTVVLVGVAIVAIIIVKKATGDDKKEPSPVAPADTTEFSMFDGGRTAEPGGSTMNWGMTSRGDEGDYSKRWAVSPVLFLDAEKSVGVGIAIGF